MLQFVQRSAVWCALVHMQLQVLGGLSDRFSERLVRQSVEKHNTIELIHSHYIALINVVCFSAKLIRW